MHVIKKVNSSTEVTLTISAAEAVLAPIKNEVVARHAKDVKIQGFRKGTAPIALVEKSLDQAHLQADFLDEAMTQLYARATTQESIRPVTRPQVSVKKFVPFTELEFEVTTQVVSEIKLPDYKKIKTKKVIEAVTAKDIKDVIGSLRQRLADKKSVTRTAKTGDEVIIDFKGVDTKGEPVQGADGKAYPLVLGSNAFIPGFEDNVIGMKPSQEKTFTLKFPKDYGVKALAGKDVAFTVTLQTLNELVEPKEDEAFAAKVGPFKTVEELESDIKKQLELERQRDARLKQQDQALEKLVEGSKLEIPDELVEEQLKHNMEEVRRNAAYRGVTLQEYFAAEGMTEDEYKEKVARPQSLKQLKISFILGEIAEREDLSVSPEELGVRLNLLKGQYQDPAMQAELDKPENQRDIASRMLSEKVVDLLIG